MIVLFLVVFNSETVKFHHNYQIEQNKLVNMVKGNDIINRSYWTAP